MSHSPRGDMHTDIRAAPGSHRGRRFVSKLFQYRGVAGIRSPMTEQRIERRAADLLPEEQVAGSADPEAQAAAILADSDAREADLGLAVEHRSSEDTVNPVDTTR
jgi:hypothetical protein